ncbi:MAG: hypothetical protein IJ783_06460 [Kiritimatiellae bacterium]|nr:hypothetical protein [Kiritimatiellia bacterium]
MNSLFLSTKYNTHTFANRVLGCVFEDNGDAETATCAASLLYLAEVEGCTFRRNEADYENGVALRFGYCNSSTAGGHEVAVRDCVFAANTNHYNGNQSAGYYYGGIVTANNRSSVEMTGCVFSGNVATSKYCGAGFEARSETGPHVLRDCLFEGNTAWAGGTVAMIDTGNSAQTVPNEITLVNCTMRGNDGPLLYGGHYAGGVWTLDGCAVSNNVNCTAISNARTGASGLQCSTTNIVRNCTFEGNVFGYTRTSDADSRIRSGFVLAVAEFDRCAFKNNSNSYRVFSSFGSLSAKNSLFAGNTGPAGYFVYPEMGELHFANCTIAGNSNKQAFLYKQETSDWESDTIVNCILSGNTVAQNGQCQSGSEGFYSHCFTDFAISGAGAGMVGGEGANPRFTDAANGDYSLKASSVCRDAGTNDPWLVDDGNGRVLVAGILDLDGNPRVDGSAVDIGCYERITPDTVTVLTIR